MEGSLRERPPKKPGVRRWEMRVYVGRDPETGRPRQVYRTFTGTLKRDADKALRAFVAEVEEGKHLGPAATLGKLLDEWLANLERAGRSRSTIETYRTHVETHIRPALGSLRLDLLTTHDVDRYLAVLADKGLSPRTIRLDHAVLSGALTQAVDWGWLQANPARRAKLKRATTEATTLTLDQLRELYVGAAEDDPDMGVTIALAAITGARRGELCGLMWSDFDRERAMLSIERAWVPGDGGQHLTTTKTGKGRTVFIGAFGVALLDGYRDMLTERMGAEPDGWLLSYNGGATPMRAKSLTEYVGRLAARLKIPVHFHTLRHFAATELVAQGVDLPTAASQLGHSTGVMADVYLHTTDERGSAAGDLIAAVVGKAIEPAFERIRASG
jgi:integrase